MRKFDGKEIERKLKVALGCGKMIFFQNNFSFSIVCYNKNKLFFNENYYFSNKGR